MNPLWLTPWSRSVYESPVNKTLTQLWIRIPCDWHYAPTLDLKPFWLTPWYHSKHESPMITTLILLWIWIPYDNHSDPTLDMNPLWLPPWSHSGYESPMITTLIPLWIWIPCDYHPYPTLDLNPLWLPPWSHSGYVSPIISTLIPLYTGWLVDPPEEFWSLVIRSRSGSAVAFLYSSSSSWHRILGSSIRDSRQAFPNPEEGTMWRGTSTRAYLENTSKIHVTFSSTKHKQ